MFAVRKIPRAYPGVGRLAQGVRGNASLQAGETSPPVTPPAAPAKTAPSLPPSLRLSQPDPVASGDAAEGESEGVQKKGGRRWPTRRPNISLENPRKWNRPIGEGVLPVYDLALSYIRRDSALLRGELAQLRDNIKAEEAKVEGKRDEEALEAMREKEKILEIQSVINLPDVRWKARNGMADLNEPIYRHLIEKRWREEGALDLVMERVHTMKVVPDLLPSLHPSFDLRITFPEPPPASAYLRNRVKRRYKQVEPGIFMLPEQTRKPPHLYTTVFHTDTRYYTLILLDLDVPNPETRGFQNYLHWMQPNIPLSAFSTSPITLSGIHTRYIPPHPQRGTPYHRYVLLMLPQPSPSERIMIPVPSDEERLGFNYREFTEKYGLDGSKGGAVHMWREVWDPTVSQIYQDVLKIEEPRYGRLPKEDPYEDVKSTKKYI